MTSGKFLALSIFALLGTAILLALGGWQLQRMHWKEALLARLEARAAADPVALADAVERFTRSSEDPGVNAARFLKVTATGRYRHDAELHLYGIWNKQPGWRVVTPFATEDAVVLIIRGFVPEALKNPDTRRGGQPDGAVGIIGRVRFGEIQGSFIPDNAAPSNQWYWRDLAAMQATAGGIEGKAFLPFFIELEAPDHDAEWPQAAPVKAAQLHNRHFTYALTWFGLAGALVVVYGLLFRARRKA